MNLEVLAAFFRTRSDDEFAAFVHNSPTGRYARITWFLYEWLLGRRLDVPDLDQGNYIPVLDPELHYALPAGKGERRVRRQRVIDNLPGTPEWCPLVRRTDALKSFEESRLDLGMAEKIARYPDSLVTRAAQFLYSKETKSSWEIEKLSADARRTARFVELLRMAGRPDLRSEAALVRLQNAIVDDRYAAGGFRTDQNYIGQSLGSGREWIHFVPPRPEDIPSLMRGWMSGWEAMEEAGLHPVIIAAAAGFGFVFLHPFDDGNGRLHRFILHHALAVGHFTPEGIIFPLSATILARIRDYDEALEAYSREIALHVEYSLDAQGLMEVRNESLPWYRYPDLTIQAEALFGFIKDTLEGELSEELEYLAVYDAARRAMLEIVDMPDRRLDLFLKLCMQGKGKLSSAKRGLFAELTDDEVMRLESAVHESTEAPRSPTEENEKRP